MEDKDELHKLREAPIPPPLEREPAVAEIKERRKPGMIL